MYNHLYGYGQLPHNQQQSPPTYHSNQPHYPSSSPQLTYQQQQQGAGAPPPPPPPHQPQHQHHHHNQPPPPPPPPHPQPHSQQHQQHHPQQTHPAYHRSASDHSDRHYVPFSPVQQQQQQQPTASGPMPMPAYGYVQQQSAVQQVPVPVKSGHGQKQSSERNNNNRISEEEDKQARIMSTLSRETYSNDGFNSIGPAAAAAYADPYNNNPSTTISSIVHSPAIAVQDLPTTLPPLNPPMMSIKSERSDPRTAAAMPYDIRDQTLRDNGPPPLPQQQHHHPQQQQQQQQAAIAAADLVVGELSPYGCDVPGCYASFPASSGLFYHMKTAHPNLEGIEKPYRCAMPNCTKRYKNINGLQYHLREAKGTSGHPALTAAANAAAAAANGGVVGGGGGGEANNVIDERLAKSFKCQAAGCKKAYRTQNGLRYHQSHVHSIPSSTSSSADHLRHTPNPRNTWQ